MILDKLGVKYIDFINGKILLEYLFNFIIDVSNIGLIIIDLEMLEVSGFEVIKQVKNNFLILKIFIVVNFFMSGSFNEDMVRSLKVDDFIFKFNFKDIQ